MWILIAEALLVLLMFIFMIWWTMAGRQKKLLEIESLKRAQQKSDTPSNPTAGTDNDKSES